MIISNSRIAERRLSCHTTSFLLVCGWVASVSYRTLAPLCREPVRLAGKTSPRIRALVLYTFNKTTKHQTLR